MKKFLFLVFSAAIIVSSCGKESLKTTDDSDLESEYKVVEDIPSCLSDALQGKNVLQAIRKGGYTVGKTYSVSVDGESAYAVTLSNPDTKDSSFLLVQDCDLDPYTWLVMYGFDTDGNSRLKITDLDSMDVLHNIVVDDIPTDDDGKKIPCNKQFPNSFDDCVDCAEDRITDDWLGKIVFGTHFIPVVALIIIHCA